MTNAALSSYLNARFAERFTHGGWDWTAMWCEVRDLYPYYPRPWTLGHTCIVNGYGWNDIVYGGKTLGQLCRENPTAMRWDELTTRMPLEVILENLDLPWHKWYLRHRADITWEIAFRFSSVPELKNYLYSWGVLASRNDALQMALEHPDKWPWREYRWLMMRHADITVEIFEKMFADPHDGGDNYWFELSSKPKIPIRYMLDSLDKYPWYMSAISARPDITIELVRAYPDAIWSFARLSANLAIPVEEILGNRDLPWEWENVEARSDISLAFKLANLDVPWTVVPREHVSKDLFTPAVHWDFAKLSRVIDPEVVLRYPQLAWNWNKLSLNPHVTPAFVRAHADLWWNWALLMENCGWSAADALAMWKDDNYYFLIEEVYADMETPYDPTFEDNLNDGASSYYGPRASIFLTLSYKQDLCWEHVMEYPDGEWNWFQLSRKMPWDVINQFPHAPWNEHALSGRPDLDFLTIKALPEIKWQWSILVGNRWIYRLSCAEIEHYTLEYYAQVVQKRWLARYYNPEDSVCKRRLAREFSELAAATMAT
jgi:hypothetical protein